MCACLCVYHIYVKFIHIHTYIHSHMCFPVVETSIFEQMQHMQVIYGKE